MITKESTDKDILDHVIDLSGVTIREMTTITFLHWISGKMNNVPAYQAATVELTGLLQTPPLSRMMPEGEKIRIIRRLLELNLEV